MAMEKTKNLMDKKNLKKKTSQKSKHSQIYEKKKKPCPLTGSMPPTTQVVKATNIDLEEEIGVQKSKIKNK